MLTSCAVSGSNDVEAHLKSWTAVPVGENSTFSGETMSMLKDMHFSIVVQLCTALLKWPQLELPKYLQPLLTAESLFRQSSNLVVMET